MNVLVAVPSSFPGGLDAPLGAHFGHCEVYTLVELGDGGVARCETLASIPHEQGGCMAPVQYLARHGVRALIAGGMGMRPLMGFQQVGIDVYYGGPATTVREAIDALLAGQLPRFGQQHTCGGGGGGGHPGMQHR